MKKEKRLLGFALVVLSLTLFLAQSYYAAGKFTPLQTPLPKEFEVAKDWSWSRTPYVYGAVTVEELSRAVSEAKGLASAKAARGEISQQDLISMGLTTAEINARTKTVTVSYYYDNIINIIDGDIPTLESLLRSNDASQIKLAEKRILEIQKFLANFRKDDGHMRCCLAQGDQKKYALLSYLEDFFIGVNYKPPASMEEVKDKIINRGTFYQPPTGKMILPLTGRVTAVNAPEQCGLCYDNPYVSKLDVAIAADEIMAPYTTTSGVLNTESGIITFGNHSIVWGTAEPLEEHAAAETPTGGTISQAPLLQPTATGKILLAAATGATAGDNYCVAAGDVCRENSPSCEISETVPKNTTAAKPTYIDFMPGATKGMYCIEKKPDAPAQILYTRGEEGWNFDSASVYYNPATDNCRVSSGAEGTTVTITSKSKANAKASRAATGTLIFEEKKNVACAPSNNGTKPTASDGTTTPGTTPAGGTATSGAVEKPAVVNSSQNPAEVLIGTKIITVTTTLEKKGAPYALNGIEIPAKYAGGKQYTNSSDQITTTITQYSSKDLKLVKVDLGNGNYCYRPSGEFEISVTIPPEIMYYTAYLKSADGLTGVQSAVAGIAGAVGVNLTEELNKIDLKRPYLANYYAWAELLQRLANSSLATMINFENPIILGSSNGKPVAFKPFQDLVNGGIVIKNVDNFITGKGRNAKIPLFDKNPYVVTAELKPTETDSLTISDNTGGGQLAAFDIPNGKNKKVFKEVFLPEKIALFGFVTNPLKKTDASGRFVVDDKGNTILDVGDSTERVSSIPTEINRKGKKVKTIKYGKENWGILGSWVTPYRAYVEVDPQQKYVFNDYRKSALGVFTYYQEAKVDDSGLQLANYENFASKIC